MSEDGKLDDTSVVRRFVLTHQQDIALKQAILKARRSPFNAKDDEAALMIFVLCFHTEAARRSRG